MSGRTGDWKQSKHLFFQYLNPNLIWVGDIDMFFKTWHCTRIINDHTAPAGEQGKIEIGNIWILREKKKFKILPCYNILILILQSNFESGVFLQDSNLGSSPS